MSNPFYFAFCFCVFSSIFHASSPRQDDDFSCDDDAAAFPHALNVFPALIFRASFQLVLVPHRLVQFAPLLRVSAVHMPPYSFFKLHVV